MFPVQKVLKKLWKNRTVYFLMMIELSIGIAFMTYSLNQYVSYRESKQELSKEMSQNTFTIEINCKEEENGESSFDYNDYLAIKDEAINFEIFLCEFVLANDEGNVREIPFIYTNLLDKDGVAHMGTEVQKNILEKRTLYDGENGYIETNKIVYRGNEYIVKAATAEIKDKVIVRHVAENRIYEKDCVFLPLHNWKSEWILATAQTIIRYDVEDLKTADNVNKKIISKLSDRHPNYSYSVHNYLESFEQINDSSMEYARYMAFLAIIGIWMMYFGYMGITKQFYIKRQKEYAICLAVGATIKKLYWEIILESIILVVTSLALGNIIADKIMPVSEMPDISYQGETFIATVFLCVCLVITINYPICHKIKKMHPQEILKSL